MDFDTTSRGFAIGSFTDVYGFECSLQRSSRASDEGHIWLGVNTNRMHLSQSIVRDLLPALQHFAETGELPSTATEK